MKHAIRLKDIAKKLNMSISTVSKSLNDHPSISKFTRERVKNAASKLNYVANESARNFQLNKRFTIGLILPDLLDLFFVEAINGIEEIVVKNNYNIIIAQSHEDVKKEENIANVMIRNRVDGLIVAVTKHTVDMELFHKFNSVGIPVMFIVREPQNRSFSYVAVNNVEGAFKATNFLIQKGHKRIAHLMGPKTLQISHTRLKGYKLALEENHIPWDPTLVKEVDFSKRETEAAMDELMKLTAPPTAVFTFKNDITLDALKFLKHAYPEKNGLIDFTDFGNPPLFEYLEDKPVASINENFYEVGKQAASLLFDMMNNHEQSDEPKNIEIPCELIIHTRE